MLGVGLSLNLPCGDSRDAACAGSWIGKGVVSGSADGSGARRRWRLRCQNSERRASDASPRIVVGITIAIIVDGVIRVAEGSEVVAPGAAVDETVAEESDRAANHMSLEQPRFIRHVKA